jgi:hypothetical protein
VNYDRTGFWHTIKSNFGTPLKAIYSGKGEVLSGMEQTMYFVNIWLELILSETSTNKRNWICKKNHHLTFLDDAQQLDAMVTFCMTRAP